MMCTGAHFWPGFPLNWLIVAQSWPTRVARNPISNWGRTHDQNYVQLQIFIKHNKFFFFSLKVPPEKVNWLKKKSCPSLDLDQVLRTQSSQSASSDLRLRPTTLSGWSSTTSEPGGSLPTAAAFARPGGLVGSVWRLLGRLANLGGYQGSYGVSLPPQRGTSSQPSTFKLVILSS